jgi:DNA-binding transcriptional LysR family regulator
MIVPAELRRAAVFHAIASEGGISAAARRLGKSAPAVHHDLKRFEADAGHPLFERAGRGLKLTAAGRLLHETIGRALHDLEQAHAQLAQDDPSLQPLRVGAVSGFGRYVLAPRLFAGVPRQRRIQLRFAEHDALLDALLHDRIDLAVTFRGVVATPIRSTAIAAEDIVLAVPEDAPDSLGDDVGAGTFVTYDEHEYVFGPWFEAVCGAQPARLRRGDHATELEEALEAVACGRGITIVPGDILDHGHWRGRVRALRPRGRAARNTLHLLSIGSGSPDIEFVAGLLRTRRAAPAG